VNPTLVLVRKELRALAALWVVIVVAMVAALSPFRFGVREFGGLFYVIGALALGANVIGHELRHGTLAPLLMQPVARSRILAAKMTVLAGLLISVAAVAALSVFSRFDWYPTDRAFLIALFVLPVAYGFLVAPWLTLLTRNPLAGTLFSGALAALLLLGGNWLGTAFSDAPLDIDAVKLRVLWSGSALLCLCGAIGLSRSFLHVQVIDGAGAEIAFPSVFGSARDTSLRRTHPVLLLVAKELRLQQLSFVAPAIYVVVCLSLKTRGMSTPALTEALAITSIVHAIIVTALAGALSCAEERALGTLQWQTLQPMAARAQFAVKAAVAIALSFILAFGVPALLLPLLGVQQRILPGDPTIGMVLLVVSGSMFVSSVSSSALVAFFSSIPAFIAAYWFVVAVVSPVTWTVYLRFFVRFHPERLTRAGAWIPRIYGWEVLAFDCAFTLVVLGFAFQNQRTVDSSPGRTARQVLVMAAAVTLASALTAAAGRLLFPF
jgi:hypothetical protein